MLDDRSNLLTHCSLELLEMLVHESRVDRVERVTLREVHSQEPEPSLQSRVDHEGSSSSVHRGNVLSVRDLLQE